MELRRIARAAAMTHGHRCRACMTTTQRAEVLQWSFVGPPELQWSIIGAAMEYRRATKTS